MLAIFLFMFFLLILYLLIKYLGVTGGFFSDHPNIAPEPAEVTSVVVKEGSEDLRLGVEGIPGNDNRGSRFAITHWHVVALVSIFGALVLGYYLGGGEALLGIVDDPHFFGGGRGGQGGLGPDQGPGHDFPRGQNFPRGGRGAAHPGLISAWVNSEMDQLVLRLGARQQAEVVAAVRIPVVAILDAEHPEAPLILEYPRQLGAVTAILEEGLVVRPLVLRTEDLQLPGVALHLAQQTPAPLMLEWMPRLMLTWEAAVVQEPVVRDAFLMELAGQDEELAAELAAYEVSQRE